MSTLTPFADMAPVPRVLIDVPVDEFPAGSVTVSVQRTCEGRVMDVRGGIRKPASSPLVVIDPEPGFQVPNDYTVIGHDIDGEIVGSWPVGSTTVDFSGSVIQQPLDPRLSVEVVRLVTMAADIERETPGDLVFPQGATLPGMVGLGPRQGIQGMAVDVLLSSASDADALQSTLGGYATSQLPVWLIRTPPDQRIPRIFFCHVPRLRESRVIGDGGYLRFSATVSEVRPPAVGITATALTHSDMKVFFSTHTEVKAQYSTHSDVKRDTSLIGAADA